MVLTVAAAPVRASVPPWLEMAARSTVPSYGFDVAAVCLLDENRTVVAENGEINEYHRTVYKILTREGLDLAWLRLAYDNETKVTDLKAWNLKSGGIVHETSQKDGVETQLAGDSGALFDDTKSLLLLIPQAEVGSILAFEYERHHRPDVLQDLWLLQEHHPILKSRIELQLPPAWEFQARLLRHETVQPREISRNHWVWEFADLPAIPKEEGMPSLASVSALLTTTYFPAGDTKNVHGVALRNWNDFGSWTSRLLDSQFLPSGEMTEIARGLGDTRAIAEYVQKKIRYVAIEIGIGGYQPHRAQDTFKNQYGDCKDKVTLFRSLMKAMNRDVYPVLINADHGSIVPEFPSPLYFNHMIAAIPIADNETPGSAVIRHPDLGRVLLFDPTDEHTPFGQLPSALQGTQAVLIGSRAVIIDTPVSNLADNRLLRVADFKLAGDGTLTGEMSENRWGALAASETGRLAKQPRSQWARAASRRLSTELPGNQIRNFAVGGLNQPNPLQESYSIEAPGFLQPAGDLLLFRPWVFGSPGQLTSTDESRTYPYQFDQVESFRSAFKFQLPQGYRVEAAPAPQELDLPFAHFKTEVSIEADSLRYTSIFEIRKLAVAAEDFVKLRDFYEAVDREFRSIVILKRAN